MERKMAARRDEVMDFSAEIKMDEVQNNGFFKGYASTFGGAPDFGGDIIAKGCFADTLKNKGRNGNGIAMLWSHDQRAPIGVWSVLHEDEKGLYVEGMIEPSATPDGIPVHKIMKMGGIRGLSIGYNTVLSSRDETKKARILQKVDLWEVSLVTFPMNRYSTVTSVKNILDARTPRELEGALREAGMDHEVSKYLVRLCKSGLREAGGPVQRGADKEWAAVAEELRRINADLTIGAVKHAVDENF